MNSLVINHMLVFFLLNVLQVCKCDVNSTVEAEVTALKNVFLLLYSPAR